MASGGLGPACARRAPALPLSLSLHFAHTQDPALEKENYSNYTLEVYSGCYMLQVYSYYTLEGLAPYAAPWNK